MPSSTFSTGTGAISARRSSGLMPAAAARSLNGDQLDGAGDDGLQLLVGSALPLQPSRVDDEHVDVVRRGRPPRPAATLS